MADLLRSVAPDPAVLLIAVIADLTFGDPVYAAHPVRLMGRLLTWMEARLRAAGLDGYVGGVLLFLGLASTFLIALALVFSVAPAISRWLAVALHVLVLYSCLALGDLIKHVRRIESAVRRDDIAGARIAVAALAGRDTGRMDGAACRRAAVESLSESLTDGFVSPVFWYAIAGLPGAVIFKVVSTMDSMVGYKTPAYLRFGWCGARLDDVMNYVPARMTWLIIAAVAAVLPGFSGRKAVAVGWRQHSLLPGPNAGLSEAAAAGALGRRLVGPIWLKGVKVTDLWIGDERDPALSGAADVNRAIALALVSGLLVTALAGLALRAV